MTTQSTQREAVGLTQDQAARLADVSVATWRRWEQNPNSVGINAREKCEAALVGRDLEGELWDDLRRQTDALNPERQGALGYAGAAVDANAHLLDVCCELFIMNMKPTAHLRSRFGSAVMHAKLCEVLADGRTYEDAQAAVNTLLSQLAGRRRAAAST